MIQFDYVITNDDLGITAIENIFINHYMPNSPGDFVKVYLLGLKYCHGSNLSSLSNQVIAKSLHLLESDVKKAWEYWRNQGIIELEITNNDNYHIKYIHIASLILDGSKNKKDSASNNRDNTLKDMYKTVEFMFGRPLSSKELNYINNWLDDLMFSTQMITLLVEYCCEIGKKDFNYLNKVALNWFDHKITSFDQAITYLEEYKLKWNNYYTIMDYLGFKRTPSKAEIIMMDKWLFEFNMSMDIIIEACKKTTSIDKPNFKYIDRIITKWHEKKYTNVSDITEDTKSQPKIERKGIYDHEFLERRLEEKMWSDKS